MYKSVNAEVVPDVVPRYLLPYKGVAIRLVFIGGGI